MDNLEQVLLLRVNENQQHLKDFIHLLSLRVQVQIGMS